MKNQTTEDGTIVVMMKNLEDRSTDCLDIIIGNPKLFSCTKIAKVQPKGHDSPANDAFARLLFRLEPQPLVTLAGGLLVPDDSTPDES